MTSKAFQYDCIIDNKYFFVWLVYRSYYFYFGVPVPQDTLPALDNFL